MGIHCLDISNVEFLVQSLLLLGHHIDPEDLIGAIRHHKFGLIRVETRECGLFCKWLLKLVDQLTDFLLSPIIPIIFCVIELEDTLSGKEKQTVCIAFLEKCCVASV